jgi:hypothetical protein
VIAPFEGHSMINALKNPTKPDNQHRVYRLLSTVHSPITKMFLSMRAFLHIRFSSTVCGQLDKNAFYCAVIGAYFNEYRSVFACLKSVPSLNKIFIFFTVDKPTR